MDGVRRSPVRRGPLRIGIEREYGARKPGPVEVHKIGRGQAGGVAFKHALRWKVGQKASSEMPTRFHCDAARLCHADAEAVEEIRVDTLFANRYDNHGDGSDLQDSGWAKIELQVCECAWVSANESSI